MTDTGGLHYIHERIDALVNQTAHEIAISDSDPEATKRRLWAAQDEAADKHEQDRRDRG
jgi:hypothetical protein